MLSRDDSVRVESPEKVAEEFNEYFYSVFSMKDFWSIPEAEGGPAGGGRLDMVISRDKVRKFLKKIRAD